ncbi:hypothetical protein AB0L40_02140 [Patulibacter sp. NPDC049589]|uniref:hypothetical protein n=1 Tax=Patulibacter sp. NPDC049589 TaxID=3154731 RepID=UPI00343B3BDF
MLFFLAALVAAAPPAGAAAAGRDTTRVDVAWMATVSGRQAFSWTAEAHADPPRCTSEIPDGPTRDVGGGGSFSLTFASPRPYRMATVQVLRRAGRTRGMRTLSYRPRGGPKIEDHVRFPVAVSIAGTFTDAVRACDPWDAVTDVAPIDGCGARQATLDLLMGFGVTDGVTRNDAALTGELLHPWFIGADGESRCPTYRSVAQRSFDGGLDTPACPDATALDTGRGAPELGLASYFRRGRFYPRLVRRRPKAFVITADVPIDCTLTPSESFLPPLASSGRLRITGALRYTWRLTPLRVTGRAARTRPL